MFYLAQIGAIYLIGSVELNFKFNILGLFSGISKLEQHFNFKIVLTQILISISGESKAKQKSFLKCTS